jgi:hypothetical protein
MDLRNLQELLLKAVVFGEPLPGRAEPVRFPDISFIARQPAIWLVNENLAAPILPEETRRPVRILSSEALHAEARTQGDITYLRFQPPETTRDVILLTLEARIAVGKPGQPMLGLSSIHVKFQRVGGRWEAADAPVYSAA